MKKFSDVIKESKNIELYNRHTLVNPVDWDEIFKPLIEHIDSNLQSKSKGPEDGLFSNKTKEALDELIDSITEDYLANYRDNIDDGSQESFFKAFSINVDYKDILDCLQPISDRTYDVNDSANWDEGYYLIEFYKIKYKDLDELIEDIEDIHLKLKILNVNYNITIGLISRSIKISDSTKDITNFIKKNWIDSWGKESDNIDLFNNNTNKGIYVYIFNKETVQS